jgi:hypothetical protein
MPFALAGWVTWWALWFLAGGSKSRIKVSLSQFS